MSLKNKGFTLVEFAVVVLLIGLIAGAVTVGTTILRNARLYSVIADVEMYKKSAILFKDKYKELPGDFSGATALWGTDPGACPPAANLLPKTTTCNGNGDGFIGDSTSTPLAITTSSEALRFWQHLSNAGFIPGVFNGAASSSNSSLQVGINSPKSEMQPGTYSFFYINSSSLPASVYSATYQHVVVFGAVNTTAAKPANLGAIAPSDAQAVDKKIDDGKPGTGNVLSYTTDGTSPTPSCATSATAYSRTASNLYCSLIFITGF